MKIIVDAALPFTTRLLLDGTIGARETLNVSRKFINETRVARYFIARFSDTLLARNVSFNVNLLRNCVLPRAASVL